MFEKKDSLSKSSLSFHVCVFKKIVFFIQYNKIGTLFRILLSIFILH